MHQSLAWPYSNLKLISPKAKTKTKQLASSQSACNGPCNATHAPMIIEYSVVCTLPHVLVALNSQSRRQAAEGIESPIICNSQTAHACCSNLHAANPRRSPSIHVMHTTPHPTCTLSPPSVRPALPARVCACARHCSCTYRDICRCMEALLVLPHMT
jgi:hypothetical protein